MIAPEAAKPTLKRMRKEEQYRGSAFRLSNDQRGSSPLFYCSQDDARWYHVADILGLKGNEEDRQTAVLQITDDWDQL